MRTAKLWIFFHRQDEQIDHWALYLDAERDQECSIWHASGRTFEFELTHIPGIRPEAVPSFKEKWQIKDNMTEVEVGVARDIAGHHPVDNEGAYWDCRIFCFEILASLEMKDILSREDQSYREVRRRLHEKWKSDNGVSAADSSDLEDGEWHIGDTDDDDDDEELDLKRVDHSNLKDESKDISTITQNGVEQSSLQVGRKRALSNESNNPSKDNIKHEGSDAFHDSKPKKVKPQPDQ